MSTETKTERNEARSETIFCKQVVVFVRNKDGMRMRKAAHMTCMKPSGSQGSVENCVFSCNTAVMLFAKNDISKKRRSRSKKNKTRVYGKSRINMFSRNDKM